MDSLMQDNKQTSGSSKIIWVIMILGTLAVAAMLAYFWLQPTPPAQEARLENAVRQGSPEFDFYRRRVAVEENHDFTTQSQSTIGGISMKLVGVIRNFTGKNITGLEVVGSVIDQKGNVIKEKTAVIIPTQPIPQLENNKSTPFTMFIEGFKPQDDRANFKFRVNAVKVE